MPQAAKALDALLRGLIDYAGLFPPSARTMTDTVERYARYRLGPDAAWLGRLVVPAARLVEWEQAAAALSLAARGGPRWSLTALVGLPASKELGHVAAFNDRGAAGREVQARVDSVEVRVASPDDVRRVASQAPAGLEIFYEGEPGSGPGDPDLLQEVRAARGNAKIRTGGLVPTAVAASSTVAGFIAGCLSASVPFKATAGLHHPVRAEHALTYEPDSPRAVMHGFLNVFVAAVLARACGLDANGLQPILDERSPHAFEFSDSHLSWRGLSATVGQVEDARRFARSFGSCSFDEPIADLKAMGAYL